MQTFDLGGQQTFRDAIWDSYVKLVNGIVFVIDSTDKERYPLALTELYRVLQMAKRRVPLLVLLNKVDLFEDRLKRGAHLGDRTIVGVPLQKELSQFINGFLHCMDANFISYHAHSFLVLGTSAKTGEGLVEAFDKFFAPQLDSYLDLLEGKRAEETEKDATTLRMKPELKKYIPYVHPRLILVTRGTWILIVAKIEPVGVEATPFELEFISKHKNLILDSSGGPFTGEYMAFKYLIQTDKGITTTVFADPGDSYLAILDLAEEVHYYLNEKRFFKSQSPNYKQIEVELAQFLKDRYMSIP